MDNSFELDDNIRNVTTTYNQTVDLSEIVRNAVKKHHKTIIRVAFTYVKNIRDAEDIAQETFLAMMLKNPALESEENCKAWLIRVAINKSKNLLKSAFRKKTTELTEDLSYLDNEQSEVLSAVLALDKKYRLVIHLYYYEGYSIDEISHILGEKSATIGTWLSRGRKLLKNNLGGFDDE